MDTGIDLEVETPDVLPNEDVADDGEAQGVVPEDEAGTDDVPVEEDVIGEDPPDDGADLMEDQAETLDPPQAPAPAPAPEPEPVAQDDAVEPFALAERGSPRAAAKQARALTFVATQAAERDSGTATESGMAMDTAAAPPAAQLAASASQPAAGDAGPTGTGAFHVVQPGETLWSIARDLLGPNASTAEIAREVDRLWRLNAKTIGTGDPNLIHTGMKLRIR